VKECRSRSVVVLTPSIEFSPQHIPGIRPIYKMRNISERIEQIFSELSGFLSLSIIASHTKKYVIQSREFLGRDGKEKFLHPNIYGWKEDSRQQCDVLVPLETPYGETTRARIWRFRSDATKMGSSARPYGPRRSIVFPPQNSNIQSIGSALRASPFVSFAAFARKHNPNVGSALRSSPLERDGGGVVTYIVFDLETLETGVTPALFHCCGTAT